MKIKDKFSQILLYDDNLLYIPTYHYFDYFKKERNF